MLLGDKQLINIEIYFSMIAFSLARLYKMILAIDENYQPCFILMKCCLNELCKLTSRLTTVKNE